MILYELLVLIYCIYFYWFKKRTSEINDENNLLGPNSTLMKTSAVIVFKSTANEPNKPSPFKPGE